MKKKPFGCLYIIIVLIFWDCSGIGRITAFKQQGLPFTMMCCPRVLTGIKLPISAICTALSSAAKTAFGQCIRDFDPDIVVCTGDMISSHARDGQAFLDFLEEMGDQYPIYMCLGKP